MLPMTNPAPPPTLFGFSGAAAGSSSSSSSSSASVLGSAAAYWRRAVRVRDMDLEYAFYLMINIFRNPGKVTRLTQIHKQTKNQWARDDPAFTVILLAFSLVAAVAHVVGLHRWTAAHFLWTISTVVFGHFLLGGVLAATVGWAVANRFLRVPAAPHSVEQEVEWAYAFDVHCHAFVPLFTGIYVVQYALLPWLVQSSMLALLVGNTLFAASLLAYVFVTFHGFLVLPFLERTTAFLAPAIAVGLLWFVSLLLHWSLPEAFLSVMVGV